MLSSRITAGSYRVCCGADDKRQWLRIDLQPITYHETEGYFCVGVRLSTNALTSDGGLSLLKAKKRTTTRSTTNSWAASSRDPFAS